MSGTILYLPTPRTQSDMQGTVVVPSPRPAPADMVGWSQLDLVFTAGPEARTAEAIVVADVLDELCAQAGGRWWFLNQDRGWRVYLQGLPAIRAAKRVNQAGHAGRAGPWWAIPTPAPLSVRPVGNLPGVPAPRALVLADLHCADSQGVLDYLREDHPLLVPRHLAGILTVALCHAAGLSTPQTADFVDQHWLDATPLGEAARVRAHGLTEMLGAYLLTPATRLLELDPYAAVWASALADAGERVCALTHQGFTPTPSATVPDALQCDLRHAVAAHWNRLGLNPADQQILAVAIRNALWAKGKR
ncbi:lantibiotic biosynthesis dehydratase-like protein [Promicromonospora sp. AC04]|uniref:lantibiotic dehydratase C-terminal domain-containing protein n=1 Tax=Promicromonospora sp. AC04 TaxID=2135723 RepID=UPI000D38DFF9|nr:lantibiotic dehydratase C-terminal domain-containing protein [Promicromonospora sp. AC04]PUB32575.1 lantibiotic biosynthesis dehydratase-like protein [Promicromonospora sp. AC04]